MTPSHDRSQRSHGSTLLLVLWTISVTTLIVIALQLSAYRQASEGRQTLGRVRAKWAARAGVEAVIAYVGWDTESEFSYNPDQFAIDLAEIAMSEEDELNQATYSIGHSEYGERVDGPADAHAKYNVNRMTDDHWWLLSDLLEDGLDEEMVASITDWMDGDDEVTEGGAEGEFYYFMPYPYEVRNGRVGSLMELELIKGIDPIRVRGEDWNLNGLLEISEDDGDLTWPNYDNFDGKLDAGWSRYLTTRSRAGGWADSGQPRVDLAGAETDEIVSRLDVDFVQAQALTTFAGGSGASLAQLIATPLSELVSSQGDNNNQQQGQTPPPSDLTDNQLRLVLAEATIRNNEDGMPGKLNLNTCDYDLLQFLPDVDLTLANQIDFARSVTPFASLLDLADRIPDLEPEQIVQLAEVADVRSNVFVIASTGTADPGRTSVELVVTIDRSSLPIRIVEYMER
ncbi:MAG: hypothetical protein HND57_15840 [Planctomycetes bacterium]|nr:hypothetical protein [Planctomycetota bacterium]